MPAGLLTNQTCLITGASGIALASGIAAAREGGRVFFVSLDPQQCRAACAQVRDAGGDCEAIAADVADEHAVEAAIERCVSHFGEINAVFNVAGISGRRFGDGPIHQCTLAGWQNTLDTNARSVFLVSRAVLRVMMEQPIAAAGSRGNILNMSSVLAFSPLAKHFATHAYAASKGAIIALTKSMAAYYAPHQIRVNALAAGLVQTPMSLRAQEDPEILALMRTKQPLRQAMLQAQDIAAAAVFLMSDRAATITGSIVPVDGGWCVSG